MKAMHIAIIDDGVNEGLYGTGELIHNIEITSGLDIRKREGYDPFLPSHGTTCAAIIKKYAPHAMLSSIKILDIASMKGMKGQLIRALEWCCDNGIRLVSLSLGTIYYRDFPELEKVVKAIVRKGAVIVAACNNRNVFTCPASLKGVIGVKCAAPDSFKEGEYIYSPFAPDGIEITACGSHRLVKYTGESKITSSCNSFAAPMATALVHEMMAGSPDISIEEIKEELRKNSLCNAENKRKDLHNVYSYILDDIDIPIVMFYNYTDESLNGIKCKLCHMFREDGYNCILACEKEEGANPVNGIVEIGSCMPESNSISVEGLKIIYRVYDPDIVIAAIDAHRAKREFFERLEAAVKADIRIFAVNHKRERVLEYIARADDSKAVLLLLKGKAQIENYNGARIFNYYDENSVDELYRHLLCLLRNDGG